MKNYETNPGFVGTKRKKSNLIRAYHLVLGNIDRFEERWHVEECWGVSVETKQQMLKAIVELPDDASVEDALDRPYLLYKVEKGRRQADRGELISQEGVYDGAQSLDATKIG